MNDQWATSIAERLDELGLRFTEPVDLGEVPDQGAIVLTLDHEQGHAQYHVGFDEAPTISSSSWVRPHVVASHRLLILAARVTERSAEMFRQMGVNYIDAAGNAFITFAGVHLDIRGRRTQTPISKHPTRLTRGGVNLFSTKRSQVTFALLSWPELLEGPVREIAHSAGVSVGQAQETLELLGHYGFLEDRRRLVERDRDRLIDLWAAAFPTGLGAEAKTGRFSGDWHSFDRSESTIWVSGEAAVPNLLRPETAVLYTDEFPTGLIRAHRWRRDDSRPNIFLRRRFWRSHDSDVDPRVRDAPPLLVYADLLAANDGRQREAAEQIRGQL